MTIRPTLQSMVEEINFDDLPNNWSMLDTINFSKHKKLWDFQQEAIKNATKCLYLYFKECEGKKSEFYKRYELNGLEKDVAKKLDVNVSKLKRKVAGILQEYYPVEDGKIKFEHFINRAAFWMATGSGKTLLIVKLVEILKRLMEFNEIPKKDVLILTHREDLISQLKKHVEEFNELALERGFKITLVELTEYERIKRESLVSFLNEIVVFYYRSDLISDEQKEKLIDFRNYENGGNWYVILDEAHKGDKEESKRQMFYSIMSRNGFLFNFSATFVDTRDVITTVYNFNLEKFISEGYGKHIYLSQQEVKAFKEKGDYNRREKQKIVLKTLILLTYLKKFRKELIKKSGKNDIYHEPLMLTLVNTVNLTEVKQEKPDLKIFFEELERIGKGEVEEKVFQEALDELITEISEKPFLIYENLSLIVKENLLSSITIQEILRYVYNSKSFGSIEAIVIPGKKQEVVFKLKTSDKPFALVKIGDAVKWIKDNLKGYDVIESYKDKSIFENLDEREDISILMGSRAFYEGWDSNRPNIILFINIGTGREAKKFVIQSIGRGVRIEPIKGKRKRMKNLFNKREDENLFEKIGGEDRVFPIETLYIFGTNRSALKEVMDTLHEIKKFEDTIELFINENVSNYNLLIPEYKKSKKKVYEMQLPQKFQISESSFDILKKYFTFLDERILLMENENLNPKLLHHIRFKIFRYPGNYIKFIDEERKEIPLRIIVNKFVNHLNLNVKEVNGFKQLENEIIHFKKIRVSLDPEKVKELKEKILKVAKYPEKLEKEIKLRKFYGKIPPEEYDRKKEEIQKRYTKEEIFDKLKIKYIANHYYIPMILSLKDKIEYIKHIIKTESEVIFIKELERFLEKNGDNLKFDWWMFSKIDEHLDEVYIPYYDPKKNILREFKPDFIFWLKKGKGYFIVFVDPKGISHTEFEHKVDSFKRIFGEIKTPRIFGHENIKIRVLLLLYTQDRNRLGEGYRNYWSDNPKDIFEICLNMLKNGEK